MREDSVFAVPVDTVRLAIQKRFSRRGIRASVMVHEWQDRMIEELVVELVAGVTATKRTVDATEAVPINWIDGLLTAVGLKRWAKFRFIPTKTTYYHACPHTANCPEREHVIWMSEGLREPTV